MPEPFKSETLYDFLDSVGGGVNLGDSPLDLTKDVLAGAINVTVTGKNATHRPAYYRRIVTYVNVSGQISATKTAVETGAFQGWTKKVCLDDTGNGYILALISGRVFAFLISGNTVTCTELLINTGTAAIQGGTVTGAKITNATITSAALSAAGTPSGALTGTITGATVTGATLVGGTITAGTVTGGSITSSANVTTAIASKTITGGFVTLGTITGVTVTGGSITGPSSVITPQAWLWQSECWVIIRDGLNNTIVVNLNTQVAVRSSYGARLAFSTTTSAGATVAPVGSTFTVTFTSVASLTVGQNVFISGTGNFQVTNISGSTATLLTQYGNGYLPSGALVQWATISGGIPPGRMGAYGLQRNWFTIITPNQFVAGDIAGGSAGTTDYLFRDAVLQSTENNYIVGGGYFSVPGNSGPITAMKFLANQDVALGQGPLQVFTHKSVFSCQAPIDRLTWQSVTNPILTESLITNGAKGQESTEISNSDCFFRSIDGFRSLTLSRQQANEWGSVPCSFEISPVLDLDEQDLLIHGTSIVFGNRFLSGVGPVSGGQGVYFTGLAALNFSPISSLRGKAPAVWDSGTWVGSGTTSQMNIFQMSVGEVNEVERAFALVMNTTSSRIEFWEILSDGEATADNDGTNDIPIPWQFDSASLRFGVPKDNRINMFLSNGELWIDELIGTVTFGAYWKPDQYPVFVPWAAWQQKQTVDAANSQPAFIPRVGLGEPSMKPFDNSTNRPLREGFTFQTRFSFVGHCIFLGAFLEAQTTPMRKFAPIITKPLS